MVHVVECSFIVAGVLPHQGQCLSRMPDMIAGSACCTAIANISIWRFHWKYRTSTLQEHHMHFTHFSPHTHCHRTWSRYTHAPPAAMKDKATAQPQTSNIEHSQRLPQCHCEVWPSSFATSSRRRAPAAVLAGFFSPCWRSDLGTHRSSPAPVPRHAGREVCVCVLVRQRACLLEPGPQHWVVAVADGGTACHIRMRWTRIKNTMATRANSFFDVSFLHIA